MVPESMWDTGRSSHHSSTTSVDGMAWAPPHTLTPPKNQAQRVPGAYMHARTESFKHLSPRLELDSSPVAHDPHTLADLMNDASQTHLAMLFRGRAAVGNWRMCRSCSSYKPKKQVERRFRHCVIMGIDNALERRLVTGESQPADILNLCYTSSMCTGLICFPDTHHSNASQIPMLPMDLTNCKEMKLKNHGVHVRIEFVFHDGRSLWLYDVHKRQLQVLNESIESLRDYTKEKHKRIELTKSPQKNLNLHKVDDDALNLHSASTPAQNGHPLSVSPAKRTPVIPKLNLSGVVNYNHEQAKPPPQPSQISVSTAVRDAEALIRAHSVQQSSAQGNEVTATTGHVYGHGATLTHPISQIFSEQVGNVLKGSSSGVGGGPSMDGLSWWLADEYKAPAPATPPALHPAHANGYSLPCKQPANHHLTNPLTTSTPALQQWQKNQKTSTPCIADINSQQQSAAVPKRRNPVINVALAASATTSHPAPSTTSPAYHSYQPITTSPSPFHNLNPSSMSAVKSPQPQTCGENRSVSTGAESFVSPPPRRLPRLVSVTPPKPISDSQTMQKALENVHI